MKRKLSQQAISQLEDYGYTYTETPEEFTELILESVPFHEAVTTLHNFSKLTQETHITYGAYQVFHIAINDNEMWVGADQIEQLLYDLDMEHGIWEVEDVA